MRTRFCNSERYALQGNLKSVSAAKKTTRAAEKNTRAASKWFSLLETVISMTVITIVFAMAVSSMLFVSTTLKKTDNQRFFGNEGPGGDAEVVNSIVAPESGSYTVLIGYDSDYNRQIIATYGAGENIPESAYRQKYFTLVITIDKSFGCVVCNFKGSVLFDGGKFYSRYDL